MVRKEVSNEQLYDLMEDIYEELPRNRRRFAVEDNLPAKPAPKETNVIATVAAIILWLFLIAAAGGVAYLVLRDVLSGARLTAPATTTALPTANMTPFPTQPAPAVLAATPAPPAPPARQPAPTDAHACVPAPGGVDLHVGSDGATIGVGNGQTCPEQQDMAVENAPVPDYGANRDTTGAWVGTTDAPVPTLAPTQAAAFAAQFKPATNNNAFVGYLPGRAPPTPWPTAPGPQPGDPGFADSFK